MISVDMSSDESTPADLASLTPLAAAVLHVGREPERVLQIGCGNGDGVLFLAREFPRARVRGVDRSPAAIRAAVARVGLDPEGRVAFKVAGSGSLPYPDDHFDLIVQMNGRIRLGKIKRLLRAGGDLVLAKSASGGVWSGWPRRRLGWHGLQVVETGEAAGGGAFCVSRRAATGQQPSRE